MDIFTASFKRAQALPESKYFVVSISRWPPKNFEGYRCFEFAPSAELLRSYKKGLSQIEYKRQYLSGLGSKNSVHRVFENLARLSGGRDIVLCCFEDPFMFCHRHILADFVEDQFGYIMSELVF